jgi:subtilisin family serine protease
LGIRPGFAGRGLARPRWARAGFGRSAFPGLPQATGRFGASPAWAALRQRFFVPPPVSLGPPPGRGIGRSRHEMEYSGVPPAGERRFIADEVVVQIDRKVARAQVERLSRELGVTVVASHDFDAADRTMYRFRSSGGRDVADVVRRLEQNNFVAAAQPNYVYTLDQAAPAAATKAPRVPKATLPSTAVPPAKPPLAGLPPRPLPAGDPQQYAVAKLHLGDVHRLARGRNVRIAVVDSAVDANHPDLAGAISENVDPGGQGLRPHPHGTGMAGAIAAHSRLLGVAPEASVVAIKVFDERTSSAEATSFQILKGLDEAMRRGAKIINMSFAGPYDVMLERKLRQAYDKGIVLVAAAGNAGPDSPPLYPAADPTVIAVTATDAGDKPFALAVRGAHVAVAAPGVDILVPAPGGAYQLTTGTSVAAAHVSGTVALMLEKRPDLTPEDVRAILVGSATSVAGLKAGDKVGLVDPLKALTFEPPETSVPMASNAQNRAPQPAPAATEGASPAAPAARSTVEQRWPR